jgi:pimeloyl-ACP methyl ester carboxylesterase
MAAMSGGTPQLQHFDGQSLSFWQGGPVEGKQVLLLHGWGGQIASMAGLAAGLNARGYCVHSLDFPGFGHSPIPSTTWGVADYAALTAQYIKANINGRVNLVGHSFGGRVSIYLGAEYASLIDKIILTDSAGVPPAPTGKEGLVRMGNAALNLPGLKQLEPFLRKVGRQALGSADLKAAGPLEDTFRKVIAEDLVPFAARIQAPTLLIWGELDQDTPLWQAQTLEKAIPDAGLVVLPGAGHYAYQERLPDFLRIADTFFKGT